MRNADKQMCALNEGRTEAVTKKLQAARLGKANEGEGKELNGAMYSQPIEPEE
jgi:hypothetical protein